MISGCLSKKGKKFESNYLVESSVSQRYAHLFSFLYLASFFHKSIIRINLFILHRLIILQFGLIYKFVYFWQFWVALHLNVMPDFTKCCSVNSVRKFDTFEFETQVWLWFPLQGILLFIKRSKFRPFFFFSASCKLNVRVSVLQSAFICSRVEFLLHGRHSQPPWIGDLEVFLFFFKHHHATRTDRR